MNQKFCEPCNKFQVVLNESKSHYIRYQLECGHNYITLELFDKINIIDILKYRMKSPLRFTKSHKWKIEGIIGNRIGKDGHLAFINQLVDRTKNYYKKYVKRESDGFIIKDIIEPLSRHR